LVYIKKYILNIRMRYNIYFRSTTTYTHDEHDEHGQSPVPDTILPRFS
jgi:hypothetical protein